MFGQGACNLSPIRGLFLGPNKSLYPPASIGIYSCAIAYEHEGINNETRSFDDPRRLFSRIVL